MRSKNIHTIRMEYISDQITILMKINQRMSTTMPIELFFFGGGGVLNFSRATDKYTLVTIFESFKISHKSI